MKEKILLIGYGVAGKIHKQVLEKKGFDCIVVEKNIQKTNGLKNICFASIEDALERIKNIFIFDICVDTSNHYEILKKILSKIKEPNIIIEKPLVNKKEDLEDIKKMVKDKICSIFVNENYLFLPSRNIIKEIMRKHEFNKYNIYIEFTKNRRLDNHNRFVDEKLLSAGIEGTHMFAVLDLFCDINNMDLVESNCCKENFLAKYSKEDNMLATLYSSLDGKIHFKDNIDEKIDKKFRVLNISDKNGKEILVYFGSSDNLMTKIYVSKNKVILEEHSIKEDSMKESLDYAINLFKDRKLDNTFEKNILFTEQLLSIAYSINNESKMEELTI